MYNAPVICFTSAKLSLSHCLYHPKLYTHLIKERTFHAQTNRSIINLHHAECTNSVQISRELEGRAPESITHSEEAEDSSRLASESSGTSNASAAAVQARILPYNGYMQCC